MRKTKVLDCKSSDNEYLHKDFHGSLCYAIKYLDETYGEQATEDYLKQVAKTYYAPLSAQLKKEGLSALEKHWQKIFGIEGGKFSIEYKAQKLILTVDECPAIAHMKRKGLFFTKRYCQTTVVVNETICAEAGYRCSCEYEPGAGKCVQKFWPEIPERKGLTK